MVIRKKVWSGNLGGIAVQNASTVMHSKKTHKLKKRPDNENWGSKIVNNKNIVEQKTEVDGLQKHA